jgi:hypothetical protein
VTYVTEIVQTPVPRTRSTRPYDTSRHGTTGVFDPVVRGKSEEAEGC